MAVDTTRARAIATRLRREMRHPQVLELCDYVLAEKAPAPIAKPVAVSAAEHWEGMQRRIADCPICAARRQAKAATMRRWRAKVQR